MTRNSIFLLQFIFLVLVDVKQQRQNPLTEQRKKCIEGEK